LPALISQAGARSGINGRRAVEIQRDKLAQVASASLADLAGWGKGETTISIALIIRRRRRRPGAARWSIDRSDR